MQPEVDPVHNLVGSLAEDETNAILGTNVTTRETAPADSSFEPRPRTLAVPSIGGANVRWWMPRIVGLIVIAALVAEAVYVVSDQVAARYQSSAIVRVSVQATSGISDPAVTAANDLASQFAQLASTAPVVDAAAAHLGNRETGLGSSVTAGTIAAQNLIRISVTGSSPAQAQKRTTTVAEAFVAYVNRIETRQATHYANAVTSKLGPLEREIATARQKLSSTNAEVQRNATVLLSALVGQERTVLNSVAQSSAAAQPDLQIVAPGGTATKVSPKPTLYAAVGFLATLLLLGRLLYIIGVRRRSPRETTI
jgi:hypothetical protein